MVNKKEIAQLVKRLRKEEPPDEVIAELVAIGEPAVIPMLSLVAYDRAMQTKALQVLTAMSATAVPLLIGSLSSTDLNSLAKRAAAARALAEIGSPEGIAAIRHELKNDLDQARNKVKDTFALWLWFLSVLAIVLGLYYLLAWLFPRLRFSDSSQPWMSIWIFFCGVCFNIYRMRKRRREFTRLAALEIAKLNDPSVVCLLAPLALDDDEHIYRSARLGLTRILPSITPQHLDIQRQIACWTNT